MSNLPFARFAFLIAAGVLILSGCASNTDKSDDHDKAAAYTDPDSGVVFPKHAGALERDSLTIDDTGKNPLRAHYESAEQVDIPADRTALMKSDLRFFLNVDISVIKSSTANPDQLLSQTIRSLQTHPNFVQTDYPGLSKFGNLQAICAQCTFDRPEWKDRATLKIVIIPRGNYLICFTVMSGQTQADQWQAEIDNFIQTIVTRSEKNPVIMGSGSGSGD